MENRSAGQHVGLYRGVVPCADCEGIDTLLELRNDGTFERAHRYLGASDEPVVSSGRFVPASDPPTREVNVGRVLLLDAGSSAETAYRLEAGGLRQLNRDLEKISGDLADDYFLPRIGDDTHDPRRLDGDWWVSELAGSVVEPDRTRRRRPRLQFDFSNGRLSFTGGCNQFAGSVEFTGPGRISMAGPFAGTRMMCPGRADLDSELTDALRSTTWWRIRGADPAGEVLELSDEDGAVARVRLERPATEDDRASDGPDGPDGEP